MQNPRNEGHARTRRCKLEGLGFDSISRKMHPNWNINVLLRAIFSSCVSSIGIILEAENKLRRNYGGGYCLLNQATGFCKPSFAIQATCKQTKSQERHKSFLTALFVSHLWSHATRNWWKIFSSCGRIHFYRDPRVNIINVEVLVNYSPC